MTAMKVKICGLTREEDVRLAAASGAWAVGFVFAPGSPRLLTTEAAAPLRAEVPAGVLAVGVFADQPREAIMRAVARLRLDAVQLHGSETPQECAGYPVPVFKGAPPALWPSVPGGYRVDAFLVEPARPLSDRVRGKGPSPAELHKAWEAALILGAYAKVILAGGLDPFNAREAAEAAKPYALDVSSGVESAPGIKDPNKVKAFFEALRGL